MAMIQLYQRGGILACLACNKFQKYHVMPRGTPVKLLFFGRAGFSTPETMGENVLAWMEAAVAYETVEEDDFLPDGYSTDDWEAFLRDAVMVQLIASGGKWELTTTLNFALNARGEVAQYTGFRAFATRYHYPNITLTDPARDELGETLWELFAYAEKVMQDYRVPYHNPNPGSTPGEIGPAVLKQLKRLGITVNPPPEDPVEVIEYASDRAVALPEALRRLMEDVDWPKDKRFTGEHADGTYTFAWYPMDDVAPWILLIVMYFSLQYYVSLRLDCADPSNPQVYEIDHDDPDIEDTFGPVNGPEYGYMKLSEFLAGLEPAE